MVQNADQVAANYNSEILITIKRTGQIRKISFKFTIIK